MIKPPGMNGEIMAAFDDACVDLMEYSEVDEEILAELRDRFHARLELL